MRQTRHHSPTALWLYIRSSELFVRNLVAEIGLNACCQIA
jgi:hypothetical protein